MPVCLCLCATGETCGPTQSTLFLAPDTDRDPNSLVPKCRYATPSSSSSSSAAIINSKLIVD